MRQVREIVEAVSLFVFDKLAGKKVKVQNARVCTCGMVVFLVDKPLTFQHAETLIPPSEQVRRLFEKDSLQSIATLNRLLIAQVDHARAQLENRVGYVLKLFLFFSSSQARIPLCLSEQLGLVFFSFVDYFSFKKIVLGNEWWMAFHI